MQGRRVAIAIRLYLPVSLQCEDRSDAAPRGDIQKPLWLFFGCCFISPRTSLVPRLGNEMK